MTSAIGLLKLHKCCYSPLSITKLCTNPDSTINYLKDKDEEFLEIMNTGTKTES